MPPKKKESLPVKKKETPQSSEVKLSSFVGKKLVDIYNSNKDSRELTLEFDFGYKIIITGNVTLKIEQ